MRVLILGGTQFIGRHVVEALLAANHRVSVFTRGRTPAALPEPVERLRGDRDDAEAGLHALRGRTWDVCVDLSGYTPRQVRPSAASLRDDIGRYVFVSAVRVYGDPTERPVRESHARLQPAAEDVTVVDDETYGALKVACEDIVGGIYAERCTILRPQSVVGPFDPVDRLSYWVRRAGEGGAMLAPGDGSDHLQFVDVRDVARFVRTVVEDDRGGIFNLAGPRPTWSAFMALLGVQNPVWVDAAVIRSAGLRIDELPLYRPEHGPRSGLMEVSNERAVAAGLALTDPAITVSDTRAWLPASALDPALSAERERELIAKARGKAGAGT